MVTLYARVIMEAEDGCIVTPYMEGSVMDKDTELRRKLDDVVSTVERTWAGHIGTHHEGCWTRHVQCLALLVRDVLDDDADVATAPDGQR